MRKLLNYFAFVSLALAATLGIGACSGKAQPTPSPLATVPITQNPTATPTMTVIEAADGGVQFKFHMSQNGSQQAGTMTLTQIGDVTQMVIELNPASPVGQAVSMLQGTCANPTGYVRDLDAVVGGVMKEKFLDFPIGMFARGNLTILVYPGIGTFGTPAACAEIPDLNRPDLPGYKPNP